MLPLSPPACLYDLPATLWRYGYLSIAVRTTGLLAVCLLRWFSVGRFCGSTVLTAWLCGRCRTPATHVAGILHTSLLCHLRFLFCCLTRSGWFCALHRFFLLLRKTVATIRLSVGLCCMQACAGGKTCAARVRTPPLCAHAVAPCSLCGRIVLLACLARGSIMARMGGAGAVFGGAARRKGRRTYRGGGYGTSRACS